MRKSSAFGDIKQLPAGPVRNVAHVATQGDPLPYYHDAQYNGPNRPCQQKNRLKPVHSVDFQAKVTSLEKRREMVCRRRTVCGLEFRVVSSPPTAGRAVYFAPTIMGTAKLSGGQISNIEHNGAVTRVVLGKRNDGV